MLSGSHLAKQSSLGTQAGWALGQEFAPAPFHAVGQSTYLPCGSFPCHAQPGSLSVVYISEQPSQDPVVMPGWQPIIPQ